MVRELEYFSYEVILRALELYILTNQSGICVSVLMKNG